jgi:hypothetical protein
VHLRRKDLIVSSLLKDLFLNSGWDLPANYLPQINLNSIREYFDELAERAYYQRLDDLNG